MTRAFLFLVFFASLTGCNTPSIPFRGIQPVTVTVEGSTFDVRVKDRRAEAIRPNMQYAPRMGPIGDRASRAIEQVSGCKVSRIGGDQAVVTAALDCGKGAPPRKPIVLDYDCYPLSQQHKPRIAQNDLLVDCTAIKRK
jgi:hypothetical protein